MEEIEIKCEFNLNKADNQCPICFSVGRNLAPLGEYSEIYQKLTANLYYFDVLSPEAIYICWECEALLRRAVQFVNRAQKAQNMLKLTQGYIYGTLSSLTTIVYNDKHPNTIYVDTQAVTTETPVEIKSEELFENEEFSSEEFEEADFDQYSLLEDKEITKENTAEDNLWITEKDTSKDDLVKEKEIAINVITKDILLKEKPMVKNDIAEERDINVEINAKVDKYSLSRVKITRPVNRWARKKALENKKPKFKILTYVDIKLIYRKVTIETKELQNYWIKKKDFAVKKYDCQYCSLKFRSEKLLEHHKAYHEQDINIYACDFCNAIFKNKRHLSTHMSDHYIKYICSVCEYCTYNNNIRKMENHAKLHQKIFQCLRCELLFGDRRAFFKHFKEHHEKFICHHCGVSFKMRYCIEDHIRKQHSPFECTSCNKQFARYNGLWLHNKVHHSTAHTAAYCVECDKRYPDVYRYRWHLANSARHKPKKKTRVPCPGCSKVFTKNIYMRDHYDLVHLHKFKYRCEQCDKNFVRNADLVKHRRRIHEGIPPPRDKTCYLCGRGFTTNKILTNHMRTHTGERPCACAHCPARFAQSAALAHHQRRLHAHTQPAGTHGGVQ